MMPREIGEIAGPQLLAILVNSGLLGVLSVQVFLYSLSFPDDRAFMKILVYVIYLFEFIQSALIIETGFRNFVSGFGDVEVFDRIETMWVSLPILTAIVTLLVQTFYAHRIRKLAESKIIAGAIVALSFVQLGGGLATGIYSEQEKYYSFLSTRKNLLLHGIWNIGSILCDIIIAVCMIYYLSRYDSTIKRTKLILKKAIRLTIETGSLTVIIGIVCFSLAFSTSANSYYEVPMFIIGKVYANSMLVLINGRMLILGAEETPVVIISGLRFGTAPANAKYSTMETRNGDLEWIEGTVTNG